MNRRILAKVDYAVQVCDLPDHLHPHEGSWTAFGEQSINTRPHAIDVMKEALSHHNYARILTRYTYKRIDR